MISTSRPKVTLAQRVWAHIEMADPVTWISPVLVVACGAIATGRGQPGFHMTNLNHVLLAALAGLMCGPLGTGFSQSINDYYDRDLDAINDPGRPIPSGRLTLREALYNCLFLAAATMAVSFILAPYSLWIPGLAAIGLILSVAYSIPSIKLKKNFWLGPPAVGFGYISMSWIAGHLIFAPMTWPSFMLAWINGGLATGMLFLNDIKSVEGDRKLGLQSMTVALGVKRTLIVAYLVIDACEVILLILALATGYLWVAGFVLLALVAPIYHQIRLFQEPSHKNFLRYMVVSNPFVVLIQFISAFVVGGYFG